MIKVRKLAKDYIFIYSGASIHLIFIINFGNINYFLILDNCEIYINRLIFKGKFCKYK